MKELTNTSERQSSDPDSDSDVNGTGPKLQTRRTRRLRRYLFPPLILVGVLALTVIFISVTFCTFLGAYSGVSFDLSPVLAHASMPVHVRACVASSCVLLTVEQWGSGGIEVCWASPCPRWLEPRSAHDIRIRTRDEDGWAVVGALVVDVRDPALAPPWPATVRTVTVRLNMKDQTGNAIFDSSAVVLLRRFQPNGPFCSPTVYRGSVVATSDGHLVPQPSS